MLAYLVERAIAPPPEPDVGGAKKAFKPRAVEALMHSQPSFSPGPRGSGWLSPSSEIAQMLLSGQRVEDVAQSEGVSGEAVRAALHGMACRPDLEEPLPSLLRVVADGRSPAEARNELGISNEEFTRVLRQLMPADPPGATRFFPANPLGAGAQQMVPVRFPEEQYQRLKDWCAAHGFSMAVVVRGLVERFLDDQDRRAA